MREMHWLVEGRKKERAKKSYGGKRERRGKMNGREEDARES